MRFVERDRVAPPASLGSEGARANRRRLLELFERGSSVLRQSRAERSFDVTLDSDVLRALAELFENRCAFCEQRMSEPVVHRFRPPGGAQPVKDPEFGHLYYAWLADAWQNLLPICPECRPEEPFRFPVVGGRRVALPSEVDLREYAERTDGRWPIFPLDEAPQFLDPCNDRALWRHMRFGSDGVVFPHRGDRRGRATIAHHRLNRPDLVGARAKVFNDAFRQLVTTLSDASFEEGSLIGRESAFPGAWSIYLRDLLAEAAGRDRRGSLPTLAREVRRLGDWSDRLTRARDALAEPREAAQLRSLPGAGRTARAREPTSIRIQNFKSIEDLTVRMPPRSLTGEQRAASLLILGENAVGKSTILEAIAIALMSREARRRISLRAGPLVLDPRLLGDEGINRPRGARIEIEYEDGDKQATLIGATSKGSFERHLAMDFQDEGPRNGIPLFAYSAFRLYLDGERRSSPHKHVRSLFEPAEPLSNPERWLLRLEPIKFDMAARALKEVLGVEGEVEVLDRSEGKVFVVQRLGDPQTGPTQRTPLGLASSGFRTVLATLCDVMQGLMEPRVNPDFQGFEAARAIVLIDEIESHLHPRWKMAIMAGLRRALPQVTFVVTSHDPLCLRGMGAREVLVLERIPGDQADTDLPVFTQGFVDLPDNRLWTIEQLLTADFFQLRTTAGAEAERRLAVIEDKVALALAEGRSPGEDPDVRDYLTEVSATLPIGDTDVRRLVEEAVATYLAERRHAARDKLERLRVETRRAIVNALRGPDETREADQPRA